MPIGLPLFTEGILPWILQAMNHCIIKQETPLYWPEAKAPVLASWSYQAMQCYKSTSNRFTKEDTISLCACIACKSLSCLSIWLAPSGKLAESLLHGLTGVIPSEYSPHFFWGSHRGVAIEKWFSFLYLDTEKVLLPSWFWGLLGCMLLHKW